MPRKTLSLEEVVTLKTLKQKGQSNVQIARTLGVTEGAVRYHVRKPVEKDGRSKPRKAEAVREAIDHWVGQHATSVGKADLNISELHAWLQDEHEYEGGYKSVLRFVRERYPQARVRAYRRIETPPGVQAQVDWFEQTVDVGSGPEKLYGFIMVLSHSRKTAVVWRRSMDQASWHESHNEAFRRLQGVPAVVRIDNLKTGIVRGSGPWGERNAAYAAYARAVGFHIDACLVRQPQQKGKVERRVSQTRSRLALPGRRFNSLDELQHYTDQRLESDARRRVCPPTGTTIEQAWQAERRLLREPDILPEVFDVCVTRPVHDDCTVNFESRSYSVPFRYCHREVEVRGCSGVVQLFCDGRLIAQHARGTLRRLVIDQAHYEGEGDDRVQPPPPIGQLTRRIQEIADAAVELRAVDYYAQLMEVAS